VGGGLQKKAATVGEYRTSFLHLLPSFNGSCKAGRCCSRVRDRRFLIQIANENFKNKSQIEKHDRNVLIDNNSCELFLSDSSILARWNLI